MITPTTTSTLKQSQRFDSVSFGIDQEDMSHICKLLRSNIYSDKILAVIREYTANAIDAQVEAGNGDRPISVTLPSPLSLAFKVRDYGTGLSEEDVRTIYSKYGKSTKRKTNLAIGEKGLGSKSGFAYGDNFLIRSFQNGIVTLYNAFIDPSQVGQIAKLHSEATTEENGIEIEIPVNERDIQQFKNKAESIFKYFKIAPTVKGNNEYKLPTIKTLFEGSNFKFVEIDDLSSRESARAVMGNISYPIDIHAVNWGEENDLRQVLNRSVLIEFNLGELETSTSREGLEYSNHTQQNIIAKARQIKDECLAEVRSKLANGKSMFEAKKIYNQIFDYYSGYSLSFLSGILKKDDLKFNGKDLTSGGWTVFNARGDNFAQVWSYRIKSGSRGSKDKVRGESFININAVEDAAYVIKDMKSTVLNRIAPLCEMENNHLGRIFKKVYLIEPGAEYDQWVKDNQFDAPTIKLSDLPKVSLKDLGYIKSHSTGSSVANSKHSENVFKLVFDLRYRTAKSDYFESTQVDFEAGGIWFEIDRFMPTDDRNGYDSTGSYIESIKKACEFLGLDPEKVVAVKTKGSHKFKMSDKWKTVRKWIAENTEKYIADNKIGQKYADQKEYKKAEESDHGVYFNRIIDLFVYISDQSKEMATLGKHMTEMRNKSFDETKNTIDRICQWTRIEVGNCKPTHDLSAEWEIVKSKYPMYKMVDYCHLGWKCDSATKQKLVDYINMVDLMVTK
jgi:hypothetical protein